MVLIDTTRPERADVDIRFPVEKMTTGDPSTDAILKGESFFDMVHFPTVRFTARDAPLAGSDSATIIPGELTMHGQTRAVTLSVRLTGVTPDEAPGIAILHFTGSMSVERSHYGMGFGRPFVSDKVDLTIDAIFRRA
jgi:polyisoprenoid-binding protein YceI